MIHFRGGVNLKDHGSQQVIPINEYYPAKFDNLFFAMDSLPKYLWQDTSRTVKATLDNDPVGVGVDLGPNGYDVEQATLTAKPTYKTNVQNSRAGLLFDGGDYLVKQGLSTAFSAATMFAVVKWDGATAGEIHILNYDGNIGGGQISLYKNNTIWRAQVYVSALQTDGASNNTNLDTDCHLLVLRWQSGGNVYLRLDGVETQSAGTVTGSFDPPQKQIGIGVFRTGIPRAWGGHILESAIYSDFKDGDALSNLEEYYINKWAIV